MISNQFLKKHDGVSFPPNDLVQAYSKETYYTYDLQKFFSINAGRNIILKGYLEDIEQTQSGLVVEFLCPLTEDFWSDKPAIRLRLVADESDARLFLENSRDPRNMRKYQYYLIAAKIEGIKNAKLYEFKGFTDFSEVEIKIKSSPRFISTGRMVEGFKIPTN